MAQLSEEGLHPRHPQHHQEHIICFQIKMPSLCNLFNAISGLAAFGCNAMQCKKQTFFVNGLQQWGDYND